MANKVNFEITSELGLLSENTKSGWQKQVNMVRWNGNDAKLDIRDWAPDRTKMSRGITLSEDEVKKLVEIIG